MTVFPIFMRWIAGAQSVGGTVVGFGPAACLSAGFRGFIFLLILIFINSCGFQVGTQGRLLDRATSVGIGEISNETYQPGLDIRLRRQLGRRLAEKRLLKLDADAADLVLSIEIAAFETAKAGYSVVGDTQIYSHTFRASGRLTIYDNRYGRILKQNKRFTTSHSLKSASTDLAAFEKEQGEKELMAALTEVLLDHLQADF